MTHGTVVAAALAGCLFGWNAPRPKPVPPTSEVAVREVRLGNGPSHLAVRDGTLFVSGFHSGRVSAHDLLSGKALRETLLDAYEVPADPKAGLPARKAHECAGGPLVSAADRLFVAQTFSEFVLVMDPATLRVVKRLPLGGEGAMAVAPDGSFVVFASNKKDEFHLIDPKTYHHTTVAYPPGGRGIGAVAVSPDGRFVTLGIQRGWTPPDGPIDFSKATRKPKEHADGRSKLVGQSFLAVYDIRVRRYVATVNLAEPVSAERPDEADSGSPFALAFNRDGNKVYAGMFQSKSGVRVIDTTGWRLSGDIRFAPNADNTREWTNPIRLAVYRDWLFVANRENDEAIVVDTRSDKPGDRLRYEGGGDGFTGFAVEADRIYLAGGRGQSVRELDGWSLARRLASRPGGDSGPPLELTLTVAPH
ncbi:YncE family protein [Zavarzinella formosa]|uniref:hypothetical protein n=1 Tax=Zavarzinella formosa TaxID=360055 RepID=UPI00030062AC|nr:hypothetical protein [Zavarzinella formosa]